MEDIPQRGGHGTSTMLPLGSSEAQTLMRELHSSTYQNSNLPNGLYPDERVERDTRTVKPHTVRSYNQWIRKDGRTSVEPDSAGPESPVVPPPTSRPRSRSLQLDANDSTLLSLRPKGSSATLVDDIMRNAYSPRPQASKHSGSGRTGKNGRSRFFSANDASSSDDDANNCHVSQPSETTESRLLKPTRSSLNKLSPRKNGNNSQQGRKGKVTLERGIVLKPDNRARRISNPLAKYREESDEVDSYDVNIHVEVISNFNSAKPVSILKGFRGHHRRSVGSARELRYSSRVTFEDDPMVIPSAPGRRASIAADENSLVRVRGKPRSPDATVATRGDGEEETPWMLPGQMPGRRRHSLPPIAVSMLQIDATRDDDCDDPVHSTYNNSKSPRHQSHNASPEPEFMHLHPIADVDVNSSADSSPSQSPYSSSLFHVPKKTKDITSDIKCDVVHSFTPRKNLSKNCVLSSKYQVPWDSALFEWMCTQYYYL